MGARLPCILLASLTFFVAPVHAYCREMGPEFKNCGEAGGSIQSKYCYERIFTLESNRFREKGCGPTGCVYKLVSVKRLNASDSADLIAGGNVLKGSGFTLTTFYVQRFEEGNSGYRATLVGPGGKSGMFEMQCGAHCGGDWEWVSGDFKGAALEVMHTNKLAIIKLPVGQRAR
jgi:hypothetical protein